MAIYGKAPKWPWRPSSVTEPRHLELNTLPQPLLLTGACVGAVCFHPSRHSGVLSIAYGSIMCRAAYHLSCTTSSWKHQPRFAASNHCAHPVLLPRMNTIHPCFAAIMPILHPPQLKSAAFCCHCSRGASPCLASCLGRGRCLLLHALLDGGCDKGCLVTL